MTRHGGFINTTASYRHKKTQTIPSNGAHLFSNNSIFVIADRSPIQPTGEKLCHPSRDAPFKYHPPKPPLN
jgi:hypothetical protein